MFSKNIKTLSLFLVLAVIMIVAVGAVSAANFGGAAITDNSINVTGTVSNDGSAISGSGSITTIADQNDVPKGSALNSTGATGSFDKDIQKTQTIDNAIYLDNKTDTTNTSGATIAYSLMLLASFFV